MWLFPFIGRFGGKDCFPVLKPITCSFKLDDLTAIQEPVNDGRGQHLIIQSLDPFRRCFVGRNDDRGLFVKRVDQIEERSGFFLLNREKHDIINGQQIGFHPFVVSSESGGGYILSP